jgi:hypothetical protein
MSPRRSDSIYDLTEMPELVTPPLITFTITNNNNNNNNSGVISRPYSHYILHATAIFPLSENRHFDSA